MSDDEEPPRLRLASSNDDIEVEKQRALDLLRWPTRQMAANLLRVMRGHGRPPELPQQIIDLAGMILEANEKSNAWGIWNVMEDVLQSAFPSWEESHWDDRPEVGAARGSLQFLASRLVYQHAQEAAGRRQIVEAFDDYERVRERRREEMRAAQAAYRVSLTLKRPKKTVKKVTPKKVAGKPPSPPPPPDPEIEHTGSTAEYMKRRAEQLAKERPR